jgi:G3E family GTPase
MLVSGSFQTVLDVRASICLIDPRHLQDQRYMAHENVIDQIALADVLVANKADIDCTQSIKDFHLLAQNSIPEKEMIGQTMQGQLEVDWLDLPRNKKRQVFYPNAHQALGKNNSKAINQPSHINEADGYQSVGYIFPQQTIFDGDPLNKLVQSFNTVRIKGIYHTNKGWFIINGVEDLIKNEKTSPSLHSRFEIIASINSQTDITDALNQCIID